MPPERHFIPTSPAYGAVSGKRISSCTAPGDIGSTSTRKRLTPTPSPEPLRKVGERPIHLTLAMWSTPSGEDSICGGGRPTRSSRTVQPWQASPVDSSFCGSTAWRCISQAQLECNSPLPPIAQLESLIQDHPTRERLWALLMKAQYRSSRQADALTTYRRAGRFLVDELGVEPGPELQELEIRVLQQDPSLLAEPRSDLPGLIRAQAGAKERRTVTVVRVANPTQSSADPEDFAALRPIGAVDRPSRWALWGGIATGRPSQHGGLRVPPSARGRSAAGDRRLGSARLREGCFFHGLRRQHR